MSSSHFTPSIYLLTFALHLQTIFGIDFLQTKCSEDLFTNNDYDLNLPKLLGSIADKTPTSGFGLASVGQINISRLNGLALCRGDVNVADCKTCVDDAVKQIQAQCQHSIEAVIWYDNCLLKYSNSDFFTKVDNDNKFYMSANIASQPTTFDDRVKGLLNQLAKVATASNVLYASGDLVLEGSKKVYGMVQCTLDLTPGVCSDCLANAINSELRLCCKGKDGGRVVGASFIIRYEVYSFLNV